VIKAATPMLLLRIRIPADGAHRTKIVRSLSRIVGPWLANTSCLSCVLYSDLSEGEDGTLLFAAEWTDEQSLIEQLRTEQARVLLSALDYASDLPDVRVDTVADTRGMEFIATCRAATQRAY